MVNGKKWSVVWAVLCVGLLMPRRTEGAVVFVDANLTTGANNGASWADAFRGRLGLAAAIASVPSGSESEVWIANGLYAPTAAGGDRELSFQMKSGVVLLGGFAGGEASVVERDPAANPAILSGDLNSNDGPDLSGRADNARHVVRAVNVDATALIDGFVITNGGSNDDFPQIVSTGAGLLVEGGAPTIVGCTFQNGYARYEGGGAALLGASTARVEGCLFIGNRADWRGAGLFVGTGGTPSIRSCEFRSNRGGRGIGVYARSAAPVVEDCLFFENLGDIGSIAGAGFYDESGTSIVRRCDFIRNATLGGGGGVYLEGSQAYITQCRFFGNIGSFDVGDAAFVDGGSPTFVSCLMRGIAPGTPTLRPDASGCIVHVNQLVGPASPTFINCTLAGNGRGIFNGPAIAAVLVQNDCVATFRNCIFWDNTSGFGNGEDASIHLNQNGIAVLDRCSVQMWTGTLPGVASGEFDPSFIDPLGADGVKGTSDDDLRLGAGSLCIDRGSNLVLPPDETLDALGQPRIRNDHATADTGVGGPPTVDLGALEFQPPPCNGDANNDGVVDFGDVTLVLANWGDPFGFGDITITLAAWGNACGGSR
jgi:hypothetical protein